MLSNHTGIKVNVNCIVTAQAMSSTSVASPSTGDGAALFAELRHATQLAARDIFPPWIHLLDSTPEPLHSSMNRSARFLAVGSKLD